MRTFQVVTYGCQMNVHDSERIAGVLDRRRLRTAQARGPRPDVVVFNTCAVRENADNRLYGNLGHLAPVKQAHPGMQIAVGGCMAQKDREVVVARGAVGRRGLRHQQPRLAAGPARAGASPARGPGRDPGVAGAVPVDPADTARLGLRGVGVDQRGLQQHLHLLHRAGAARQGDRPATRRRAGRDRGAGRPRACRRSPCWGRT